MNGHNNHRHTGGRQWDADRHNHRNPTNIPPATDGGLSKMLSPERMAWLIEARKQLELRRAMNEAK